jgi:DNA mismatch endonuclease (patch repair protein)
MATSTVPDRVVATWASSPAVRRSMQGNRRRDTGPELRLRSALHALGLRFRVDRRPVTAIACRADVVFARRRLAIFVDGCYWHGCPTHFVAPVTNRGYWAAKVEGNRQRDASTASRIEDAGWRVIRVWEHEDAAEAAQAIARLIRPSAPDPVAVSADDE